MKTLNTPETKHEEGFTLLELSIVLVIIGLIVGGVLVGQDMIKGAQIRATVAQLEKYNTAVNTFRKANDEWKQYRDAECARRRDHAPKDVSADDYQLACTVELTRRRALDMR